MMKAMIQDKTLKKDLVWNTLGSLTYAAASAILAFLVMRVAGAEDGGIFGFGYSTFGQQMFIIAYFGIRPFHITDVKGEYRFREYRKARIATTLASIAVAALYLGILADVGKYTPRKAVAVFLISLIKIADGYADVFECECQRSGILWRGGRELCFRTLLFTTVILVMQILTGDLLIAGAAGFVAQVVVIVIFSRNLEKAGITVKNALSVREENAPVETAGAWKGLLRQTSPLFFSVFLDFFVFSGAKYAIDMQMNDAASGIFNILFMPTSVIYLLANFVIKPFMTRMATCLSDGDKEGFVKIERRIALLILALTGGVCILAALIGKWGLGVFEWILGDAYAGQLTVYSGEFILLLLGGGLYALANLFYYVLVIRREQKAIFFIYLAAAVITLVAAPLMVGKLEITGAAIIYAAMMSVLVCGMAVVSIIKG